MKKTNNQNLSLLLAALLCGQAGATLRAATTILPGPDQLAPGTANQDAAPDPFTPAGLTGGPSSIFTRDQALGDLGGIRGEMRQKGFVITPTYIGEVMGNPTGGIEHGITYDGLLNTALDIDLERVTGGLLKDLTLHTNALWIHGQGLSVRKVGDFSNTSNISGYNTVRLQELWLEQALWDKRVTLRVGLLAADAEFFASSNSALFLNGTFGAFTLVGANLPDPPSYPVAAPGVRLAVAPVSFLQFQVGVFGGDSGGSQDQNNHGTNFNLRSRDGALISAEAAYLRNQSPGDRGLQGTYKIGSFVHTGSVNFPTFDSQTRDALGTGPIKNRGTNYGIYAVIDQDFIKAGGRTVSSFLRIGGAPENVNFVNFYVDGGFNLTGFVPGRQNDVAGVGVAYSSVSNEFSRSQRALGEPGSSYETVVEVSYKAQLAPWWFVQPDLQYIFNPSGVNGSHDALVLGARTAVTF